MNYKFVRGDGLGDMKFECTKLKGFPMEIPKVVLTLPFGFLVVTIRLVYVGIKAIVVEEGIEFHLEFECIPKFEHN